MVALKSFARDAPSSSTDEFVCFFCVLPIADKVVHTSTFMISISLIEMLWFFPVIIIRDYSLIISVEMISADH